MIPNCKQNVDINLLNMFYPIGSYYETSNIDFDPNVEWGGTWVQDTQGYVTVGANTNGDPELEALNTKVDLAVGGIIGEKTHKLTVNEMPAHTHGVYFQGFSGWTKQTISDKYVVNWNDTVLSNMGAGSYTGNISTSYVMNHSQGGSNVHNNIQPSIGVIRWHRTA